VRPNCCTAAEMQASIQESARALREGLRHATAGLIGRETLAELIVLAAVAQEHLLVIGPPGTAKSAVVRRVAQSLGGQYFEYMLGRFTEPSELFGAVDIKKLREGTVETNVTGMLPEAEVAFLDEVFLGSTAILNTLLGVLNERRFRRGHTDVTCPLRVCVGASNALPDDESLAAFADRFLIHAFVSPVEDALLESLLQGGWQSDFVKLASEGGIAHLDVLARQLPTVDMVTARPALADAIRQLRAAGVQLSDRRVVKTQRLVAASALLAGRQQATPADIWPLLYALPTLTAQQQARDALKDIFAAAEHPHLMHAVEHATLQPRSRAARLAEAAERCLVDAAAGAPETTLRAEAVLREIDANFTASQLPAELVIWREKLRACLRVDAAAATPVIAAT